MYIGTRAQTSCLHLFVFLLLEPASLNFSCRVTLSSRKQIKSQGSRAALTTLEYNNGWCALKNSCHHTLRLVYIYTLVLADSDGLAVVYFVTVQIMSNPFGRDDSVWVEGGVFLPHVSEASCQSELMLRLIQLPLWAHCIQSGHLSGTFPVHYHVCLGKSSLTYVWYNKHCRGEEGHRREIGFLLLSRRAGIWVLPVSPHASLHLFLTHSATT